MRGDGERCVYWRVLWILLWLFPCTYVAFRCSVLFHLASDGGWDCSWLKGGDFAAGLRWGGWIRRILQRRYKLASITQIARGIPKPMGKSFMQQARNYTQHVNGSIPAKN